MTNIIYHQIITPAPRPGASLDAPGRGAKAPYTVAKKMRASARISIMSLDILCTGDRNPVHLKQKKSVNYASTPLGKPQEGGRRTTTKGLNLGAEKLTLSAHRGAVPEPPVGIKKTRKTMAFPVAAAIVGGASLLGSAIGAKSVKETNKQNIAQSNWEYIRQRQDNLSDWNMQNNYNSPQEQMKRWQAAGLNPNLIYGQGNNSAANMATANSSAPAQRPTSLDFGGAVRSAFDTHFDQQIKTAQLDNLKAQNTVLQEEALLKEAQKNNLNNDFNFKQDTYTDRKEYETYKNADMGNRSTISANEAEIILKTKPDTIEKAAQTILNMKMSRDQAKAAIDEIKQRIDLQKLDENLKQMGVTSHDPFYFRLLAQLISQMGISPKTLIKK